MSEFGVIAAAEELAEEARAHLVGQGVMGALEYIRSKSSQISPEEDICRNVQELSWVYFADSAVWGDLDAPDEDYMRPYSLLPADFSLGNHLAGVGKELGREPGYEGRSHQILRYAAEVFEVAYVNSTNMLPEFQVGHLLEDYTRVMSLQDEAGDREGARTTALKLAPHLLAVRSKIDLDHFRQIALLSEMRAVASHIGIENPLAQALFREIGNIDPERDDFGLAIERFANGLIRAGNLDKGLAILKLEDDTTPGFIFWDSLDEMLDRDDNDSAERALAGAVTLFPDMFTSDKGVFDANLGRTTEVLTRMGKDEELSTILDLLITDSENPQIHHLEKFAYYCGQAAAPERLSDMLERIKQGASDSTYEKAMQAYQWGVNHATERA